ncbi:hypothetical protein ACNKHQ_06425 [Shigella flexneri]
MLQASDVRRGQSNNPPLTTLAVVKQPVTELSSAIVPRKRVLLEAINQEHHSSY